VRCSRRRLGLGRDPVADRADRRGLVFPEHDREALVERVRRLRESPEQRRRLATAGRSAVERMFSVPAATDSLERLLAARSTGVMVASGGARLNLGHSPPFRPLGLPLGQVRTPRLGRQAERAS